MEDPAGTIGGHNPLFWNPNLQNKVFCDIKKIEDQGDIKQKISK